MLWLSFVIRLAFTSIYSVVVGTVCCVRVTTYVTAGTPWSAIKLFIYNLSKSEHRARKRHTVLYVRALVYGLCINTIKLGFNNMRGFRTRCEITTNTVFSGKTPKSPVQRAKSKKRFRRFRSVLVGAHRHRRNNPKMDYIIILYKYY